MNISLFMRKLSKNMLLNRKRNGKTQGEVARVLNISRTYYSEIENNKAVPSLEVLLRINSLYPFFLLDFDADRSNREVN